MAAELKMQPQPIAALELLDSLVTSVFLLDRELHVTYLNAAAQTLLGLSPNQVLGRRITDAVRGAESLLPLFERARQGGEGVVQRELAWPAAGRRRPHPRLRGHRSCAGRRGERPLARDRGHHAASAADARERAACAARREPSHGSSARARDQESAGRPARRRATARARVARSGAARVHARHHQRGRSAHQLARLHAGARASARRSSW